MPAILYILISVLLGMGIITGLKPYWEPRVTFIFEEDRILRSSFLLLPSAYLIGTLALSWVTYFLAVFFRQTGKPLLYANLISLILSAVFLYGVILLRGIKVKKILYEIKKYGLSPRFSGMEWFILLGSTVFWSLFVFRSLYMDGPILHAGYSAFSDFGAHLPVIRSFSEGLNFPAQYPHFPDGTMRYHFMFYFMAGNLEYLGLNLPWALNLPSILSIVSFNMLLYGLAVGMTKKPLAGFMTCLFFTFRSSFAFFTFSSTFQHTGDFFHAVKNNLDASGNVREHIGNTMNESWGLWAQKVYINQRHLAFAFGVAVIVLFLLLPVFIDTVKRFSHRDGNRKSAFPGKSHTPGSFFSEAFLSRDAWLPKSVMPCVLSGILLGLLAFWNGAVVIASISILFIMAALSKHKLEYLITAILVFLLSTLQSKIFVGSGTGAVSIQYKPGFLAKSGDVADIASFYIELLGLLPFVLMGIFLLSIARKNKWAGYVATLLFLAPLLVFMPAVGLAWHILLIMLCLVFFLYLAREKSVQIKPATALLIPVFSAPILLASTLQLTPDITVNHKYIILAGILLTIPVSELLACLVQSRKTAALCLTLCLSLFLVSTGFVDMTTLFNLDKRTVAYSQNDPLRMWALTSTHPDDIFLTHYATHYGAPMSILLSGRMVYHGYPYFTVTAGYDTQIRDTNMKELYRGENPENLRELALSEGIRYIVVEEQNRTAAEYELNEDILYEAFPVAYTDPEKNIVVFSVQ